jgi:hypothetical protein
MASIVISGVIARTTSQTMAMCVCCAYVALVPGLLQVDAVSEESDGEGGGEGAAAQPEGRGTAADRKTRAKRNRAERHKAAEQELAARRAAKKQRRDLENLKEVWSSVELVDFIIWGGQDGSGRLWSIFHTV